MFQLHNLKPLVKKKKRVGRGGSRGGTSGKGHKGQKARSGKTIRVGFEGGQMPLFRRLPKRGFNNTRFQVEVKIVSLDRLNTVFEDGATVNKQTLIERGVFKGKSLFTVKVLGTGTLEKKLTVHADAFSKKAAAAIEQAGGQVVSVTKEK